MKNKKVNLPFLSTFLLEKEMTFCLVMNISELIKYLNQYDIYKLSQVNRSFYNYVKSYLDKIHSWIHQKCVKFIYYAGENTADDWYFSFLNEIKDGDLIEFYKSDKTKWKIIYIFFNGIIYLYDSKMYLEIENGPSISKYPPRYWTNDLFHGIYFRNDVGITITKSTLEYSIWLGCRYLLKIPGTFWPNKENLGLILGEKKYLRPNNRFIFPDESSYYLIK